MPASGALSPRVLRAIEVAATLHEGQYRKGTQIPYISHPYAVMALLMEAGSSEGVLIAALLHDVLEDCSKRYSGEQLESDFGSAVLAIVLGVTKDPSLGGWREQAEVYLAQLARAPKGSLEVCAADKVHNLQCTLEDLRCEGDSVWDRFRTGCEGQLWWYASVLEVLESRIPEHPLVIELRRLLGELKDPA